MNKVASQVSVLSKQSIGLSQTNPLDTHKLSSVAPIQQQSNTQNSVGISIFNEWKPTDQHDQLQHHDQLYNTSNLDVKITLNDLERNKQIYTVDEMDQANQIQELKEIIEVQNDDLRTKDTQLKMYQDLYNEMKI